MARRNRNHSLIRVLTVAKRLRGRPQSLRELACELNCCVRTIRRDVAALEEVHAPIVRTDRGWYMRGEWL
jgi:predicted DNA-binding transcriptional regulator YafY